MCICNVYWGRSGYCFCCQQMDSRHRAWWRWPQIHLCTLLGPRCREEWGENGYARIAMLADNSYGACFMYTYMVATTQLTPTSLPAFAAAKSEWGEGRSWREGHSHAVALESQPLPPDASIN